MAEEKEEFPLLLLLLRLRSLTASNKLNQTRKYCQEQQQQHQQQQRGVNNNKYEEDHDEEEEEGSQCANFQDEANFACFEIQF